jgi:hypothetical protein
MPTSPSPRRAVSRGARKAPPPPVAPARSLWPRIALIGVFAAIAVVVAVLPASLANKFLPPIVRAEDFSGTLWHGSAGHLSVAGRDAGALEWHLHPLALLKLHLGADLHWVKGSFVVDGATEVSRSDFQASDVSGGGPISDLSTLGLAAGWRGVAEIRIRTIAAGLSGHLPALRSAVGEIDVSDLSSPQVAGGSDLGNYALSFDDASLSSNGDARAALVDKGGPLSLAASITLSPQSRTGMLSGTVKERPDAPPALRKELDNVAQLRARDSEGRLPIDLEFTF